MNRDMNVNLSFGELSTLIGCCSMFMDLGAVQEYVKCTDEEAENIIAGVSARITIRLYEHLSGDAEFCKRLLDMAKNVAEEVANEYRRNVE